MGRSEWDIIEHYASKPPVDVKAMANALGLTYVERRMHPDESGGIEYKDRQYIVFVNDSETEQRKRFTAAHEIAHYLLHRDILRERGHMDRLFDSAAYDNPEEPLTRYHEVQANKYAASLLMPKFAIRDQMAHGNNTLSGLAEKFNVSRKAMRIRLDNLGVVDFVDE